MRMFTNVGCEVNVHSVRTASGRISIDLPSGITVKGKVISYTVERIIVQMDPETTVRLYFEREDCPDLVIQ